MAAYDLGVQKVIEMSKNDLMQRECLDEKKQSDRENEIICTALAHPGHFIRRLHQISVAVFLHANAEFNITQTQYATLLTVNHYPGIDQITLSKFVALDRQTTSSIVNRLVEKQLLRKRRKNGRTNELYITSEGQKLIEKMSCHDDEIDQTLLAPLTDQERSTFMSLLAKLVEGNNKLSRAPYGID